VRRFRELASLVLSAGLLATPFNFHGFAWLAFIAFLPYFSILEGKSSAEAFRVSFIFGAFFYALIGYPLALVTIPGYLTLVIYLAFYVGIVGLLCVPWMEPAGELNVTVYRRHLAALFYIPAVWVALEYFRGVFLSGIPWAFLAYSQWQNLWFIQIADMTGPYGVSFFVLLVNLAVYKLAKDLLVRGRRTEIIGDGSARRRYRLTLAALLGAVFLLIGGYGVLALRDWENFEQSPREKAVLRVAVVQGNIPQDQKWDNRIKNIIFEKYKRLTFMCAIEKSDLIVWPETAFPGYLEDEAMTAVKLRSVVRQTRTEVLVGSPTIGNLADEPGVHFYNSAVHFGADGEEKRRYGKIHLVPFGEYVPLEPVFGIVRRFVEIGDFTPGREFTLFDAVSRYQKNKITAKFATLICYEDMFPSLVRRFCKNGAYFLINMTNDAWFGKTSGPYQHAQASVFRAIENRVNVIRAANTGWSCFIAPTGHILSSVEDKGEKIMVTGHKGQNITLRKVRSFYTRFGDVFMLLILALLILAYRDRSKYSAYSRL